MWVINQLLALSLNHLVWVIAGLLSWGGAYWQLYEMKADTFGKVVTLILSVLPLGIAFVSFNMAVARWSGKKHYEAWVFLGLGLVSLAYFLWLYASQTEVRKVLEDRGVVFSGKTKDWNFLNNWRVEFSGLKTKMPALILQILVGAISVLVSVTLLISGGWELIQGSVIIGLILAPVGAVMLALDRWPKEHIKVFGRDWRISLNVFGHKWRINVFEVTYSALMVGRASPESDTTGAAVATVTP
jgi:hypothetical protein